MDSQKLIDQYEQLQLQNPTLPRSLVKTTHPVDVESDYEPPNQQQTSPIEKVDELQEYLTPNFAEEELISPVEKPLEFNLEEEHWKKIETVSGQTESRAAEPIEYPHSDEQDSQQKIAEKEKGFSTEVNDQPVEEVIPLKKLDSNNADDIDASDGNDISFNDIPNVNRWSEANSKISLSFPEENEASFTDAGTFFDNDHSLSSESIRPTCQSLLNTPQISKTTAAVESPGDFFSKKSRMSAEFDGPRISTGSVQTIHPSELVDLSLEADESVREMLRAAAIAQQTVLEAKKKFLLARSTCRLASDNEVLAVKEFNLNSPVLPPFEKHEHDEPLCKNDLQLEKGKPPAAEEADPVPIASHVSSVQPQSSTRKVSSPSQSISQASSLCASKSPHSNAVAAPSNPLRMSNLSQLSDSLEKPRLCKRFLCHIGESRSESFWFRNSSDKSVRIQCLLIPLSLSCDQFSISPSILTIPAGEKAKFVVTFVAQVQGAISAILQFKSESAEASKAPYEVIIDAMAKKSAETTLVETRASQDRLHSLQTSNIDMSSSIASSASANSPVIEISPRMVQFTPSYCLGIGDALELSRQEPSTSKSLLLTNYGASTCTFTICSEFSHIQFEPRKGKLHPRSGAKIRVWPISRPHMGKPLDTSSLMMPDGSWRGRIEIHCNGQVDRVEIVLDREVMDKLPELRDVAQTRLESKHREADTYLHTSSRNRRGLYFSAEKIYCARCIVGERSKTTVKLCNATSEPITVFLQQPRHPFRLPRTSLVLRARSYVQLPIAFSPKKAGTFSTTIHAFSMQYETKLELLAQGIQ